MAATRAVAGVHHSLHTDHPGDRVDAGRVGSRSPGRGREAATPTPGRLMGTHMKKLPFVAQIVGAVCIVLAVAVLAGWAWGLLLTGVVVVAVGVLDELRWI